MLKKPKGILKPDFMLNAFLDEGLYFKDRSHMDHFITKYAAKHKKLQGKASYNDILEHKSDFMEFIRSTYG